eukprot:TRINITY_DN11207_c0_g1_i1.p1 TRINITY_DN11207_c0_g1~~TRINITY_DN11207_c0_g1_i1.p1  ORF type:complete len:230 (-),score=22.56 TRINITY_DN11207_c0_g1_i1:201-890(-)
MPPVNSIVMFQRQVLKGNHVNPNGRRNFKQTMDLTSRQNGNPPRNKNNENIPSPLQSVNLTRKRPSTSDISQDNVKNLRTFSLPPKDFIGDVSPSNPGNQPKSYLQAIVGSNDPLHRVLPSYDYVVDFHTKIRLLDREVPKTNSDVKSTWSRNTLTAQVPSIHYHSKSVEEVFQANNEFDNLYALQVSSEFNCRVTKGHLSGFRPFLNLDVKCCLKRFLFISPLQKRVK